MGGGTGGGVGASRWGGHQPESGVRSLLAAGVARKTTIVWMEDARPCVDFLPLRSSFWPTSESTWAGPKMYLPEFYSPSSSHVPGAAGKVPVRPIAIDNLRHFPHDHGN